MPDLFDDSFRQEMIDLVDELRGDFQAGGLDFKSTHTVAIKDENNAYNSTTGKIIATTPTLLTIDPRPEVFLSDQYAGYPNIVKIGDAQVKKISRSYTREQLQNSNDNNKSKWLIDGMPYSLVNGTLTEEKSGLFWEAILIKEQYSPEG